MTSPASRRGRSSGSEGATRQSSNRAKPLKANDESPAQRFSRVIALIVALEHYRKPDGGEALPSVSFARADAEAVGDAVRAIFKDMPSDNVRVEILQDGDVSLTAMRDHLSCTIRDLATDDLFIFYYAGHGFHAAGGNRLCTYDTDRANIAGMSLSMSDDLLEPLAKSACRQALVFIDACAEQFRGVVESRDEISNLEVDEVAEFLDSGWDLGVFLSCSPGEKSYPSKKLGHGVWTHFLLEALSGRAERALTRDRWLTDFSLGDYLRQEVPRFMTRETSIRGTQTPRAIVSATNAFRIHRKPRPPAVPANAALAGIHLRNHSEYLEGIETGAIRRLGGFKRGVNTVPTDLSSSADSWCHRLLADRVAEELQKLYQHARNELGVRRRDLRREDEEGAGDLDTPAFRYVIETGQNPDDPAEYFIRRRLELREGWPVHRAAIDKLFGNEFERLVIEFESMDDTFDDLVERLEDIGDEQGGDVEDDDRQQRVAYCRNGVTFTFDLNKRRLEISFGKAGALQLVDAAQQFQLGLSRSSPMLAAPAPRGDSAKRRK